MINVEKIKPTGIFTNYIYKAIPLAFDESMSYYECLCGLLSYLKDTVIPALNNNADAILEVQNLITELQNYVDNYFDNLDVQEEINNKLDEMAEDGQLTDIIAQYLGLAGVLVFDNVAGMKTAQNLVNGSIVKTLGYSNIQDLGGSFYKIRTITNNDIVDNAFIISLHDETLIAELILTPILNVTQLGVNANDEISDILQVAINKDEVKTIDLLNMNFDINDNIVLKSNLIIKNGIITSNTVTNIFSGDEVNNVTIDNVSFDGSNTCQTGIYLEDSNNLKITNCKFNNMEILTATCCGISLRNCYYGLISQCEIYNIGVNSIGDEHYDPRGILVYNSKNIIIDNCYIHDIYCTNNHGDGIQFDSGSNTEYSNNKVTNCVIQDCIYRGIKLQQSGILIENNKIIEGTADRSLQQSGIAVYNNDITIRNNYISQKCDIAITIGTSNSQTDEAKNIIIDGNRFDFKNSLSYGVISIPNLARIVENVTICNNIFNILDENKKPYSILLLGKFNKVNIINNLFNGGEVFTKVQKASGATEQSKNNLVIVGNNGNTKQSLVVFDENVEITNGVISNNTAYYDTPLTFVSGQNSVRVFDVTLFKTFKINNNRISSSDNTIIFYDGARPYGATSNRPTTAVNNGYQYFDTTLHQIVVFYNNNWYLPDGTIST